MSHQRDDGWFHRDEGWFPESRGEALPAGSRPVYRHAMGRPGMTVHMTVRPTHFSWLQRTSMRTATPGHASAH